MGRPVIVQNDVRVGGYGEFRLGAGRGYRNILAAFVGTGIGGCVISEGKVVEGSTGNAGEVGHIIDQGRRPQVRLRPPGLPGGLRQPTRRSRGGSPRPCARGTRPSSPSKVDKKSGRLKSGDLAEAVAAQDPVALQEVHRAAHYLGLGLGSLVNVLGPEIVIIGGGVTEALGAPWIDLVRASIARRPCWSTRTSRSRSSPPPSATTPGVLGRGTAGLREIRRYKRKTRGREPTRLRRAHALAPMTPAILITGSSLVFSHQRSPRHRLCHRTGGVGTFQ